IVEALLDYYDLGVRAFLLRGFDPLADAHGYGRELIPLLRAAVAQRETGLERDRSGITGVQAQRAKERVR
ncbi:MAG: hypothetical protein O3B31_11675, partial [Chloroflexi bacterium]|nr:hypothetical protein [Chloroflexota bacterium]